MPGKNYPKPKGKCYTCNGSGTVTRTYKDKKGITQSETKTCPSCHGTGER